MEIFGRVYSDKLGLSLEAFLFGIAFIAVCAIITLIIINIGKKNK